MHKVERALGGFLGLAMGDALGAQVEFKRPGTFDPVREMKGGGFFRLRPGQITDDTQMALISARNLLRHNGFHPKSLMEDFLTWRDSDECFDVGNSIREALDRFREDGEPFQGVDALEYSGNGSIMRLYPSVLWTLKEADLDALRIVWDIGRVTHSSEIVYRETQNMLFLIRRCFRDTPPATKLELLDGLTYPLNPTSTGYVADTMDCALWAFMESDSFEEGLLKVVNLGGDADTGGAVYGQIAGSWYGVKGLPEKFLNKIEVKAEIAELVPQLLGLT